MSNKHQLDFIQAVLERFWRRWSCDVFLSLVIRHKRHVERRKVAKGDVVLIQDDNFPSQDGQV